ncbi:MAG: putative DNA binding domain-containing protein [Prevotella sp.]|nr:putative DNA binding domain-containing protein [Prevotella sp.]
MENTNWIEQILCGETSRLQFKRERGNGNALAAEFVAFANSKGGTVLFGVEDKKGTIAGLRYEDVQELSQFVANIANEMVHPTVYIQTETLKLEGRIVLAVHIEEGTDKPYKDAGGNIWVKQGADKRRVTENSEILRLFSAGKAYNPDESAVAGTSLSDLDDKKINNYLNHVYGKERGDFGLPFDSLMKNLRVITPTGELTLAGLLYFGKNPQQYRPVYCIKAVAFSGNSIAGTSYRDSRDLLGTIPELFDDAMHFLDVNLHHVQHGQSFNSLGVLEVSRIALEEIVQNALCHREYIKQAPIRLLIFDDRIEIVSPGALPDSLTIEDIKLGNTAQRNPLICTFCSRTMPYRGLGSGIIRALGQGEDIEFVNEEQGNQFKVIIKRKQTNDMASDKPDVASDKSDVASDKSYMGTQLVESAIDKSKFLGLVSDKLLLSPFHPNNKTMGKEAIQNMVNTLIFLSNHPLSKSESVAQYLGLSQAATRVYLHKLTQLGIIKPNGSNKNRTYSMLPNL